MEYPEIHESEYNYKIEKLIYEKDNILSNIKYGDDELLIEKSIKEINDQIDVLDIRMIKSVRDNMIKEGLIDPKEIIDKDLTNFKNLSEDIRGKMMENIIFGTDNNEIKASLIKLYDSLPQFSTSEKLPNNIYKTVNLLLNDIKQISEVLDKSIK